VDNNLLLEIKDLRLNFTTFDGVSKVLAGVNLKLYDGDVLGLVGETGCGKTMTALSIPHLIPCPPGEIVGGQVLFEGRDVLHMSDKEIQELRAKELAVVFQDPKTNLNPVFTVEQQLVDTVLVRMKGFSARLLNPLARFHPSDRADRQEAKEKAADLLDRVGIPDYEERISNYPHEFSGGMRQRVLIAMALSGSPRLLIADEPTTALDVSIQAQILRLIQNLVQELDLSVLLITHNLGIVARTCQRVAVMYAGTVVECGSTVEIFKAPKHPYTGGLLRAIPRRSTVRGEIKGIPGSIPDFINPPPGCRFHPRCQQAMPRCSEEEPPVVEVAPGHEVSCFLFI
jgi:oligopeptide/dipeptide ABC transporter ATP-binding protein